LARLLQPAFTRGEISPQLHARVDLALYQTGLKTLRNFIVRPQGGVSNRPGTQYVSITADSDAGSSILIPFIFSTEQAYILEFAEERVRVFTNGSYVEDPASANTITSVTLNPGPGFRVVNTATPHGYSDGDIVHISGVVGSGAYQINGAWRITVTAASQFVLDPPDEDVGSYVSGGVTATDIQVETPYQAADLADLRFTQSADVLTVVHKDYPVHEFRRLSASSFTFTEVNFESGPFLDVNDEFSAQIYASAALGNAVTLTATTPASGTPVFTSDMVGSLIKLESRNLSTIMPWESGGVLANETESTLGVLRRSEGKVYRCVTDFTPAAGDQCRSGSFRPVHEFGVQSDGSGKIVSADVTREGVSWEYLHSGFGVARITGYISATQATCRVLSRFPDDCVGGVNTAFGPFTMTGDGTDVTLSIAGATDNNKYNFEVTFDGVIQAPELFEVNASTDVLTFFTAPGVGVAVSARQLGTNNRTDLWYRGAWSEVQGYPSLAAYFGDRLFYAASREQPQTIWGSRVGAYNDFSVSSPSADDDALNFTQNARQINAIRDMIPMEKLVTLTSNGAFKITDGQDEVLTPTTVGFKPQSFRGAKRIRTIMAGDEAVFVHDAGRELRTLGYRFDVDKFTGVDLNIMANHLFVKTPSVTRTVVDMDYAEEPHSIIHVVRSDGKMLALTYDQEQEVVGWATADTLDGQFERVCVIPEDSDSAVYAIVLRTIGDRTERFIERFATREIEDIHDGVFLDSCVSFDGRNITDTSLTIEFPVGAVLITASAPVFSLSSPPDLVTLNIEDADGNSYSLRGTFVSISDTQSMEIELIGDLSVSVQIALDGRSTTDWSIGFDTFSGLSHLEGGTVTIYADGGVEADQVVSGGQIVLANPAVVVHVGIRITCDFEPLQVNVVGAETVRDLSKHIGAVSLVLLQSRDIQVGPDADHLDDVATREESDEYDASALVDGVYKIHIASTLSTEGNFFLRHDEPFPLTILAAIPEAKFGTNG
jgi:hypothetical protein